MDRRNLVQTRPEPAPSEEELEQVREGFQGEECRVCGDEIEESVSQPFCSEECAYSQSL